MIDVQVHFGTGQDFVRRQFNIKICVVEVVGALVSVMMIWVVTGVLVYMAIQRVISDDYEIEANIMLITSAVGVAVNLMSVNFHLYITLSTMQFQLFFL